MATRRATYSRDEVVVAQKALKITYYAVAGEAQCESRGDTELADVKTSTAVQIVIVENWLDQ